MEKRQEKMNKIFEGKKAEKRKNGGIKRRERVKKGIKMKNLK